jgi:hypothetical protein
MPKLQEVFVTVGIPKYTFVQPQEYPQLLLDLSTPGKGIVIEGPSGIGKTTAVQQAILEIYGEKALILSARNPEDLQMIEQLPSLCPFGIVVVDDFHRLSDQQQIIIADLLKYLADTGARDSKLIIIGINQAGRKLIDFGFDLATRISVIEFECNPREKVLELVNKGELCLNVEIGCRDTIVDASQGSFYMAQELCRHACLMSNISQTMPEKEQVKVVGDEVVNHLFKILDQKYHSLIVRFATGPRFRREGRAPYYHIAKWFGEEKKLVINLQQMMNKHPEQKPGVTQVLTKGYLQKLLLSDKAFSSCFFLSGNLFIIQDPQLLFYLSNVDWEDLREKIGFLPFENNIEYDFALSFAGEDRAIAEAIYDKLTESEINTFYDKDHASEMLAEDIEQYLAPIYASNARFVICILGEHYPKKIWTVFESKQYAPKIGKSEVIPIVLPTFTIAPTDSLYNKGRIDFQESEEFEQEIDRIVGMLREKLSSTRQTLK